MKDLLNIIVDLDNEIARTKMFINESGYHHGTFLYSIVKRYRDELKAARAMIHNDFIEDGIVNYSDIERQ